MTREQANIAITRAQEVIHDIKTPITIIGALAQELERAPDMPKPALVTLSKIQSNYRHTAELFMELSNIENLGERESPPALKSHNIVELIRGIIFASSIMAESKSISITFIATMRKLRTDIDGTLVERILLNLISNAVKFTPRGGDIEIKLSRVERGIEIAVQDSGVGFYDYELVNPFARKRIGHLDINPEGSGIGLCSTREMARALGGTLIAKNGEHGKGARVTVILPITPDGAQVSFDDLA